MSSSLSPSQDKPTSESDSVDKTSHMTPMVNVTVLLVVDEISACFYFFFLSLALPNEEHFICDTVLNVHVTCELLHTCSAGNKLGNLSFL